MQLYTVLFISVDCSTRFRRYLHPSSLGLWKKIKYGGLEELNKLIKHKNIVSYIKVQRLSRFGHVQRMPDTRTDKKIFKWNPLTKRSQRRPKYRWEDNVKQDICQMKVKNWMTCVQGRGKWKDVIEKAVTFNHWRKFSLKKKICTPHQEHKQLYLQHLVLVKLLLLPVTIVEWLELMMGGDTVRNM